MPSPTVTDQSVEGADSVPDFRVSLENFDGPFDLLLRLIGRRQLDITEVALGAVTREFISYLEGLGGSEELERASEFLVVAATLLDMKVVGLLPQGEFVDAEDVKSLEARDLLFARLLQYRAFREVSGWFATQLAEEASRHPRTVALESYYRDHTPQLNWTLSVSDFAALAALALTPKALPVLSVEHLHAPLVSVREQAIFVLGTLRSGGCSFRELIAGVGERGVIVARFLAVLELYRQGALGFHQLEPLGELSLHLIDGDFSEDQLASLGAEWSDVSEGGR